MFVQIEVFGFLKFILAVAAACALVVSIYLAYRRALSFWRAKENRLDRKWFRAKWQEIEKIMNAPGEGNYTLAILEADKLLDHVLKSMSMPGNDLGERLKFAANKYDRLYKTRWAHRVRNQIVHETAFEIDRGLARKTIKEFKRALEEVGAL